VRRHSPQEPGDPRADREHLDVPLINNATTIDRPETAMALGIYFAVQGMTAEKFAAVHEQLAAIGQANPPGRTFHAGFHVGNGIHVFDVWESRETFEAFGRSSPRTRSTPASRESARSSC
jgi:hypothetical protein